MCLYADKENPLKGKRPIRFDKKGYATSWKVYEKKIKYGREITNSLCPPYQGGLSIKNGWIVSNRKSKKIDVEINEDRNGFSDFHICLGIHVYTTDISAEDFFGYHSVKRERYVVVPVRCHKSQLVAVSNMSSEAVFMKVFLKKADYDKALSK